MEKFKKLFAGRYGQDQLSSVLNILALILLLVGAFSKIPALNILAWIPLTISVFRTFSKNIEKRRMENYKFSILISPLYRKTQKMKNRIKSSKTHKYFKCPNCKTTMKAPKGKGKIRVTCSKCSTKFEKRT